MTTVNIQTAKALLADSNYGPARIKETITGAAIHASGTILGRVTASGSLAPYAAANVDGSEAPTAVLLEEADASLADVAAIVGYAGIYVETNMVGLDAAAKSALEPKGIYFK